ncbi:MAG: DMT family transporter [Chloroflexota bacterium]|nr:DMT family transporter [Chloroflexota bacterium]
MNRLPTNLLAQAVAPVFVLIWSTGFIGARYGMPYAEPATFLVLRFGGVLALMIPLVLLLRVPWPSRRQAVHIAVAGVLIQGGYLLGVFEAIRQGMGAGLAALIVGLQPVLTAVLGSLVRERITGRQWLGLALGLAGVTMVVWERLSLTGLSVTSVAAAIAALLSITCGTLYQKRHAPVFDLRIGSVIHFSAGLLLVIPVSLLFEHRHVEWTGPLIGALLWSVVALSLGATSLLFLLIQRGAATKVASLMYLTPAVTAVMAWILFGENLSAIMMFGMAVTAAGVASMLRTAPTRRVVGPSPVR